MARKGKVSAYARYVGKMLREGKSMKAAARAWKSGKKVAANPRHRKHGRKVRHNTWFGQPRRHAKASRKGWRRGHRGVRRHRIAANPWSLNAGRKHRRSTRRRGFFARIGRKPGGFGAFKESFKDLLKLDTFIEAAQITGGGLISVAVPNLIIGSKLGDKLPDVIKSGYGKYLVNLAAAALASGAAGWFGKKRLAKNFLIGGVAFTVNTVVMDLLRKQAVGAAPGSLISKAATAVGVSGMGALPSSVEAAVDRAVEQELARQGLRDALPFSGGVDDYLQPGVSDYLQPGMSDIPSGAII